MSSSSAILFILMIALAVLWGIHSEKKESRRSRRTPRRVGVAKSQRKPAGAAGGR